MSQLEYQPNEGLICHTEGATWGVIDPGGFDHAEDNRIASLLGFARERESPRLVISGTVAATDPDDIASAFARWSPQAKAELESRVRKWEIACTEQGIQLLIWPKAGTLVSDIPGLLGLGRKFERIGVVLDPEALVPSEFNLEKRDLFERLRELVAFPRVQALVMSETGSALMAELVQLAEELKKPVIRVRAKGPVGGATAGASRLPSG